MSVPTTQALLALMSMAPPPSLAARAGARRRQCTLPVAYAASHAAARAAPARLPGIFFGLSPARDKARAGPRDRRCRLITE